MSSTAQSTTANLYYAYLYHTNNIKVQLLTFKIGESQQRYILNFLGLAFYLLLAAQVYVHSAPPPHPFAPEDSLHLCRRGVSRLAAYRPVLKMQGTCT